MRLRTTEKAAVAGSRRFGGNACNVRLNSGQELGEFSEVECGKRLKERGVPLDVIQK